MRFHTRCFVSLLVASSAFAQQGPPPGEWPSYGADKGSTSYSPLDQINPDTIGDLAIAWRWSSPDNAVQRENSRARQQWFESTPLMVNGVLYTSTSFSQVAAIHPGTGESIWEYDPESWKAGRPANVGFVHRGVAHWGEGDEERIIIATGDRRLIAINAESGKPISSFGKDGEVDLTQWIPRSEPLNLYTITSPPIICNDVIVVGSVVKDGVTMKEMPPGHIRGYDARTGERLWTFHAIPQGDEFGVETWENDSWKYSGNTNVWAPMSADEDLGYVYLPFGAPTNDLYGGHRLGDNLYANSLVCLNAKTGERVWHFQTVHHDLWDYDLASAPNLADITVDGKAIKAVAQVTKQGFCFVFDRVTGEPVWPIEERPVPQSDVPGERTAPTQPFPTRPLPFETQGMTLETLINFTPEIHAEALHIANQHRIGPLFTPPSTEGTIMLPGFGGGANWAGAALDPETNILYIPSFTEPVVARVAKPDPNRSNLEYVSSRSGTIEGPRDLPLTIPPYARMTAIDLNTGDHAWMVPLGDGPKGHRDLRKLDLPDLGSGPRWHAMVTKSLVFLVQTSRSRTRLLALDKQDGRELWDMRIPIKTGDPTGSPMTYMHEGKQYIVFAAGGTPDDAELIALTLP